MTKEDIILNHDAMDDGGLYSNDQIYSMMDEYGQSQSIAFAEWAAVNDWYFNKIKRWSNRNQSSDNLIEVLSATKTTAELYTLFLQTQE